ncbi:hypothetical protein [Salinisphaera hydrothermalis]|uniref:hypothetical protein n=1 Tax=Salinisphaera hydrothermalis TaxID=563188 RepID=UPI00333F66EA
MHKLQRKTTVRIAASALALAGLLVTTSAWAIDGAGALGQATGPNGSMNGSIYVPERQATHPQSMQPQQRYGGRYRRDHERNEHRRYGNEYGPRGNYRINGNTGGIRPETRRPLDPGRISPDRRRLEHRFGD